MTHYAKLLMGLIAFSTHMSTHAYCSMSESLTTYGGYPGHNCILAASKPTTPYCVHIGCDAWQINSYNAAVEQWNIALELYTQCIKTYLDNAPQDIECAREKIESEMENAVTDYRLNVQ